MKKFLIIMVEIETSSENPNQIVETIFSDGAVLRGYTYESMGITDAGGAEIAIKLKKE
jgi:hypothetical protein